MDPFKSIPGGLSGRKKVALVLIALGPELASSILRHFDETEVEKIALEISSMKETEHDLVNNTLDEFYQLTRASELMALGGKDYAEQLLKEAFGTQKSTRLVGRMNHMLKSSSLPF